MYRFLIIILYTIVNVGATAEYSIVIDSISFFEFQNVK